MRYIAANWKMIILQVKEIDWKQILDSWKYKAN